MKRKGKTLDGIVTLLVLIMAVIVVYTYITKENTDFTTVASSNSELKGAVTNIETRQQGLRSDQEALANQSAVMMASLSERIKKIEEKKVVPQQLNLTLTEPLRVSIVYRKSVPKEIKTPIDPGPLLKRAGIRPLIK